MKNIKIRIIGFLCVFLIILTGCSRGKKECEIVIHEFETACNDLDFDSMLQCINPKVSDPIRLVLKLTSVLTEKETNELIEKIGSAIFGGMGDVDTVDLISSIDIEVTKYKSEGKNGFVYADISFQTMGIEMKKSGVFDMIYIDKKWYINNFTFK